MVIHGEESRYRLSLIVPVYNEDESIAPFLEVIQAELAGITAELEILFIDDGSTDGTRKEILNAAHNNLFIRYVRLSRNFGKEAAMTAGLEHATGDAVVPIDVDLQDPPELIHKFFKLWQSGYDTVYGVRTNRNEDAKRKRASANMFYRLFNRLSNTPIPPNTGDFRLMDRRVVEAIRQMPERNRFMKGMFAWPGYRSIGVEYDRPSRHAGESKWNYWKLWNFALDGVTSFSTWPLRVWSYVGVSIALLSLFYMFFIIIRTIMFGISWPGYASIMSAVLFLGAVQLISIGVLGEYVGRLYMESKHRPVYIVSEKNFD
ncbi:MULTISPECIES: glycosyltransferase [Halomonadaceae]|uniref:glycosyltransferase n=1 Tax=Halomonadaceae TaxID=28256 RepID=UPI00159B07F2|nr:MULTISPECIES: glycosyltransferase [Halomonas]QJQ96044.1 glycosyltransferase [Halomonas sp. PA5]